MILNDAANQLMDLLMEEATLGQDGWMEICHSHLHALLLILRRELAQERPLRPGQVNVAETVNERNNDPIRLTQHYIRMNLRRSLTIEKTAQHFYMSRTQFTQPFRRETGQSFTEYLTHCRLEEAKTLLSQSNWNTTQIARYVGLIPSPGLARVPEKPQYHHRRSSGAAFGLVP
jgi:AraC-like DNA-binding protein